MAKTVKKPEPVKKKTPSARVIAAMWIANQLNRGVQGLVLEAEGLTNLAGSRVNVKKREKVLEQIDKLAGKFVARMRKILDKFNNPPAKAATNRKPPARKATA